MLLLHEFHARKFLLPDKLSARERERQGKRLREAAGEDGGADDYEEPKSGARRTSLMWHGGPGMCCSGCQPDTGVYSPLLACLAPSARGCTRLCREDSVLHG